MPGETVSVVHIDETKALSIAQMPLEVVQQGPRKIAPNIYSIPVHQSHTGSTPVSPTPILTRVINQEVILLTLHLAKRDLACLIYMSLHVV